MDNELEPALNTVYGEIAKLRGKLEHVLKQKAEYELNLDRVSAQVAELNAAIGSFEKLVDVAGGDTAFADRLDHQGQPKERPGGRK